MYQLLQSVEEGFWKQSISEVASKFSSRVPTHHAFSRVSSGIGGGIIPCNRAGLTWKDWCLEQGWGHGEPLEFVEGKGCFLVIPDHCVMTNIREVSILAASNQLIFSIYGKNEEIREVYSILFAGERD
jgi:hypothetical protein